MPSRPTQASPSALSLPSVPAVSPTPRRGLSEKLGDKLGQRVVVENNAGGGGIAAARAVLSAPADGHTLALLTNGTSISVSLFKNLTFDPLTDFAPVSKLGAFEFFFAVKADSPFSLARPTSSSPRATAPASSTSARSIRAAPSTCRR